MRAYALTDLGTDVLKLVDMSDPVAGPGEVLIRNRAAGVNNIDLLIRQGMLPPAVVPLPHVLGVEGAGVVEAIGEGVTGFGKGDVVFWLGSLGAGAYGPYSVIDAAYVAKLPDGIAPEIAAAAPAAYATARNVLFTYGSPERGSWVLIHSAAGGVGTAALQLARNAGFRTVALTTAAKIDFVLANGADVALDRQATNVVERIRRATGPAGVALSLNSVGGDSIAQDLEVLAPYGQVVSFGRLAGPPTATARDLLVTHQSKCVAIRLSDLYTLWRTRKAKMSAMLRQIADDLATGAITPQVGATFAVADAVRAHELLASGAARGKIVLTHPV